MGSAETDHGQGEAITVKGIVRRVAPEAEPRVVESLNYAEATVNLADAIKELQWRAVELQRKRAEYDAADTAHRQQANHVARLHRRVEILIAEAGGKF